MISDSVELRNSSLFLAHPTCWNKCMTSKNAQCSSRSGFRIFKISREVIMKCLYLARIGRSDFLWSVNKLARSITKWTKACDKRLNRLISNIHHTCEYKPHCHVGNTAKQSQSALFSSITHMTVWFVFTCMMNI